MPMGKGAGGLPDAREIDPDRSGRFTARAWSAWCRQ
jgi:hypothetical protein